jgi:glycosyltransferase involved in cell wall biosynthesis
MRKTLLITLEFPPIGGGAGVVASNLTDVLSNLGYNISLVTLFNVQRKDDKIIQVKSNRKTWPIKIWKKLNDLDLNDYDNIILNDIGASLIGSYFFDKKTVKKTIVFLHGSEPEIIFIKPKLSFRIINFKRRYSELLLNCKTIIAVSDFMKYKFLTKTEKYYLNQKIIVMRNGINQQDFFETKFNDRKNLNVDEDVDIILSVGRFIKEKGFFEVYKVFKKLILENEKFHWIIIGDGKYYEEFLRIVISDDLKKNITLIRKIDRIKLKDYYSFADVFCLYSLLEESLGLVYLEAQFCNTPVIGRNFAGVKEVIQNEKTGYLVDDPNQIYTILKNKKYKNINKNDFLQIKEDFNIIKNIKIIEDWIG